MHDVVVIGGGLGGLSAALACARRGLSVLIVEKEPRVGGFSVSFERKGFLFDVALHVVPGGGEGGEFRHVLEELGIGSDLVFLPLRRGLAVHLGDESYVLPNDGDQLFSFLSRAFPAEAQGLARFRRTIEGAGRAYARLFDRRVPAKRAIWPFLPRLPGFLLRSYRPTSQLFNANLSDPRLRALLFQAAVFYGIPSTSFPAVNYLVMFAMLHLDGMYTLRGGGQALVDSLCEGLSRQGAEVRTDTTVVGLRVEGDRVTGIRLHDGEELSARHVVANVNLPTLVDKLIGRRCFPRSYLSALDRCRPSLSVLQLHLGLTRPVRDLGIDAHLTVRFPDSDVDGCLSRRGLYPEGFSVTAPALEDDVSGRERVLSVVGGVSGEAWCRLDGYAQAKKEATQHILALVDDLFPGVASAVQVSDLSTPRTFQRYANTPCGAILGFAPQPRMHRHLRTASRPPIGNLHLASAWTDQMGGLLPALKAGLRAAERISG